MALAQKENPSPSTPEELAAQAMNPDFWREIAPKFTIEGKPEQNQLKITDDQKKKLIAKMDKEAYVHVSQPGLTSPLKQMCDLLGTMVEMNLPPVFAFAYDEFWNLHMQVRPLVKAVLE